MHEKIDLHGIITCRPVLTLDLRRKGRVGKVLVSSSSSESIKSQSTSSSQSNESIDGSLEEEHESSKAQEESSDIEDEECFAIVLSTEVKKICLSLMHENLWTEKEIELDKVITVCNGMRISDSSEVKVGTFGIILPEIRNVQSVILGDRMPRVEEGKVVRRTGGKMIVQLHSAPAARIARLVLVQDKILVSQPNIDVGARVRIWYFNRKIDKVKNVNEAIAIEHCP